MTGTQGELGRWALELKYRRWRETPIGEEVLQEVIRRARALKAKGFRRYGIDGVWTAMRYDRALRLGPDGEGYKLNNNWRSFLADEIEETVADLKGFLTRRSSPGRAIGGGR